MKVIINNEPSEEAIKNFSKKLWQLAMEKKRELNMTNEEFFEWLKKDEDKEHK